MYKTDLSGQVAVVTGGYKGIGCHIAEALHAAGATLAITGRHEEPLREAAAEIGEACVAYPCDQRDPRSVEKMAKTVRDQLGDPSILVNNAAAVSGGVGVIDTSLELWQECIETNLTGVFLTTQAFLPGMIKMGRGDIFMIHSMSGKRAEPGWAAYGASKFGLRGFAQALLYEVRAKNIRVTVLSPSTVDTQADTGPTEGHGLRLHAADLAATLVHLCAMPRRTFVPEMEFWGTDPP